MVLLLLSFCAVAAASASTAAGAVATADEALLSRLRSQRFVQVGGAEPILRPTMPGGGGNYIEMGDIIRDFETYYLYFHGDGIGGHGSYSIGVASAPSPLGPWKMHDQNPILFADQPWEGSNVAMGSVVKRGVSGDVVVPPLGATSGQYCPPDCGPPGNSTDNYPPDPVTNATYFLWYSAGCNSVLGPDGKWNGGDNTGLATAPHPLGPWTKFKFPGSSKRGGPVMNLTGAADFPGNKEGIYNSQVVELTNGTFLMYGEIMSGPGAEDQRAFEEYLGGVGIWRAEHAEGPFTWAGFGPVPGGYGSWDDGGTSGGSVRQMGASVYEMWHSGSKMRKNSRILPREENAGVSYSLDGLHWSEGYANPVVRHGVLAGPVGSFGEVHFHYEHPFRYVYHTLRWLTDSQDKEDIGVQVVIADQDLAAGFRLRLPLSPMDGTASLVLGQEMRCGCSAHSAATAVPPQRCSGAATPACISTEHLSRISLTAQWLDSRGTPTYNNGSNCTHYNLSLSVHSSLDGTAFDDQPARILNLVGTYRAPSPPPKPPTPPSPCAPVANTTDCPPAWHCATCDLKRGTPTDCMSCIAGYTFQRTGTDCSGPCLHPGDGGPTTAVVHERSTTPIALSEIGGRWLSVSATLQEHRGTGGKQAGACPLREFSVTATLIADPH